MLNSWKRLRSEPLHFVVPLLASFFPTREGADRHTGKFQPGTQDVTGLNAEVASTIVTVQEVQAERVSKEELILQNARFNAALHHLPVGLSMFDSEHRLIVCNGAYREIYDVPEELSRPGTSFAELMRYYVKRETGRDDLASSIHLSSALSSGRA